MASIASRFRHFLCVIMVSNNCCSCFARRGAAWLPGLDARHVIIAPDPNQACNVTIRLFATASCLHCRHALTCLWLNEMKVTADQRVCEYYMPAHNQHAHCCTLLRDGTDALVGLKGTR